MQPTCIVIVGPTAVGKTELAITLANYFNTDIISADARQCFKELTIGVAKPAAAILQQAKHYFINSHSIQETTNAGIFETYALKAANTIFQKNEVAIVVGGTGLYIKAFCEGIDTIPPIPPAVRNKIITNYEDGGLPWLQNEVQKTDPTYYATGEIHNPQRLIRALEVKLHTQQSIREFQAGGKIARPFHVIKIGLHLPRELLYQRINLRVTAMLQAGLLQEVQPLLPFQQLNALQTVGYQELFDYINGQSTLPEAIETIKKNTRHYAKRQLTWFKKEATLTWFLPDETTRIQAFITSEMNALPADKRY